MSDLLNSASLVMIPSGYKEDTVYSVVPSDGSGDLSFTRASNGTRINSAGLVEVCPWNLFDYSEGFNASYWTKRSGVTITADSTNAPNGTTTADTVNYTSGDGYVWSALTLLPSTRYTISLYAKGGGTIQFNAYWGTGTSTSTIRTLTSDWQRLEFSFITGSTTALGDFGFFVTATCFIWGAQLNIGSTAKPYFPTIDRLNVPRLTYQNGGGGCPSLLLEKQSTNIIPYSETFQNWTTGFGALSPNAVTANYGISPDGTQNADRIQLTINASNTVSQIYQFPSSSTTTYTASVWLKSLSGTPTVAIVDSYNITGGYKVVTLTTEWVRHTFTFAAGAGGIIPQFLLLYGTTSNSADFLAWGYQLEASSYPTSYIPTTSSSATRVADDCFKTGISSLIGQTEGTVFFDGVINGVGNTSTNIINSEKNTTCSFYVQRVTSTSQINAGFIFSGTTTAVVNGGTIAIGQRIKIGWAYKSGSNALYINGTLINSNSTTFTPPSTFDDLFLNDNTTYFGYQEAVQFNQVALFKTRLTNAQLASLTTI